MATTSINITAAPVAAAPTVRVREQTRAWRLMLHNPMALAGVAVVLVWVAVALLAPLVAPYDPIEQQVCGPNGVHHGLGGEDVAVGSLLVEVPGHPDRFHRRCK